MREPIFLDGRTAIVTGAGRGIGRAIALNLAARGARIAVWDVDAQHAADAVTELQGLGAEARAYAVDVAEKRAVDEAAARALKDFGRIDILVNNAGWDRIMPFVATDEALWDRIIAINYKGVINCCRSVVDHMIEHAGGKIVSIASDAGRVGSSGEAVYAGAKGAVIAFSKTLARELARYQINVNVVCPGPTNSASVGPPGGFGIGGAGTPEVVERIIRTVPFRRLAEPREIAAAVAFLVSDDASFITGQTLSVSGGLTMM
jgi:2-hydroxycyclohexanecarboxyl-CoA dehydrogenase